MTYGILASQSCLLTKIAHALQEKTKKAYTVDRLSDHLKDGINCNHMTLPCKVSHRILSLGGTFVLPPPGFEAASIFCPNLLAEVGAVCLVVAEEKPYGLSKGAVRAALKISLGSNGMGVSSSSALRRVSWFSGSRVMR